MQKRKQTTRKRRTSDEDPKNSKKHNIHANFLLHTHLSMWSKCESLAN